LKRFMMLCAALTLALCMQQALTNRSPGLELVVGMGSYRVELNPYKSIYAHEMQIFTAIYEGLFSYDPRTLDPVRALAETFEKSPDGKTWTFRLRVMPSGPMARLSRPWISWNPGAIFWPHPPKPSTRSSWT
jgi:ABC-type oligopeptide transport system substrate-binding subunit